MVDSTKRYFKRLFYKFLEDVIQSYKNVVQTKGSQFPSKRFHTQSIISNFIPLKNQFPLFQQCLWEFSSQEVQLYQDPE